jgi:hypothetical protein
MNATLLVQEQRTQQDLNSSLVVYTSSLQRHVSFYGSREGHFFRAYNSELKTLPQ